MVTGHPGLGAAATGTASVVDPGAVDRAALARSVLLRAEQLTGARRWSRPAEDGTPALAAVGPAKRAAPGVHPPEVPGAPHVPTPRPAPESVQERPALPVPGALVHLVPAGLPRGSTVVVDGSTSLLLALVSEASRAGSWVAMVGLPRVGLLAAQELGVVLSRLALVPVPGPQVLAVVAALIDGMDVVLLGADVGLTVAERRRLSSRARERGCVLVSATPWPGAQLVLTAESQQWSGLGAGDGRLRGHRLTVRRDGRGQAAEVLRGEVVLRGEPVLSGESVLRAEVDAGSEQAPLRLVG